MSDYTCIYVSRNAYMWFTTRI